LTAWVTKPRKPIPLSGTEKYGYDKPLVIKMTNIIDPNDVKIFISPKQFCETLNVKPKKLYACLDSESKIIDSKYKLEIISFPVDETKYATEDVQVTKVSDTEVQIDTKIIPKKGVKFIQTDFNVLPTGVEFSSGNKLQMRIKSMRKHKFVSIAEKCPELIKEWDELNNGVPADKVPHALKENAFWICQICGARYEMRIDNRTRRQSQGCKKCINKKTKR
jgi:hypothetical protein